MQSSTVLYCCVLSMFCTNRNWWHWQVAVLEVPHTAYCTVQYSTTVHQLQAVPLVTPIRKKSEHCAWKHGHNWIRSSSKLTDDYPLWQTFGLYFPDSISDKRLVISSDAATHMWPWNYPSQARKNTNCKEASSWWRVAVNGPFRSFCPSHTSWYGSSPGTTWKYTVPSGHLTREQHGNERLIAWSASLLFKTLSGHQLRLTPCLRCAIARESWVDLLLDWRPWCVYYRSISILDSKASVGQVVFWYRIRIVTVWKVCEPSAL